MGVKVGDKIAISANNTARWGISYLAIVSYRAVAVPILNGFTAENLQKLVDHSDSVALFTERKMWANMSAEQMPQLKGAICIEDFTELWSKDEILKDVMPNLQQLFRAKYPQGMKRKFVHYEVGGPDDLNTISYTSGTTSSPKGIMLSNNNISSNITFGVNRIKMPLGSSIVSMLPLAHLYGLAFEFIYPICSGATIYFLGKMPTPTLLMQAFRDVRPYMLITVPLVLEKIIRNKVIPTLEKPALKLALKIPGLSNIILSSVRKKILASFGGNMKHIIIGGAAISGPIGSDGAYADPTQRMTRTTTQQGKPTMYNVELGYTHRWSDTHFIDISVAHNQWRQKRSATYDQTTAVISEKDTTYISSYQFQDGQNKSINTTIKLDYEYKINENHRIEAGYQSNFADDESPVRTYTDREHTLPDTTLYNQFSYKQDIHALYATYSGRVGKFGFQVGLRGE